VAGKIAPETGQSLPPAAAATPVADIDSAMRLINDLMADSRRSLRFRVDELSGRTVITVLDRDTKEVVRQIPPPQFLALVRHLERAGGLLDDHT
jgi:flagellar protein FlaG